MPADCWGTTGSEAARGSAVCEKSSSASVADWGFHALACSSEGDGGTGLACTGTFGARAAASSVTLESAIQDENPSVQQYESGPSAPSSQSFLASRRVSGPSCFPWTSKYQRSLP